MSEVELPGDFDAEAARLLLSDGTERHWAGVRRRLTLSVLVGTVDS